MRGRRWVTARGGCDRRASGARLAAIAGLCGCLALAAGCREEDGPTVRSLQVEGNEAVSGDEIEAVMTTRASGRLPWARREHFDEEEFRLDLQRVRDLYNQRGYPDAAITDVTIAPSDDGSSVALAFTVREGTPVTVERVDFFGLDLLPERAVERLRGRLPVQAGEPRQQAEIAESRDMVLRLLQERGYPYASVRALEGPGEAPRAVTVTLAAEPGPEAVFGPVSITGNVSVADKVIREHLAFEPGERFRASRLRESQRRLYGLDLFQFALVDTPDSGQLDDLSGAVPVAVTVTEAKPRRARLGVGYGSEEKARAQMEWRHANFLGGARTAALETKWSSLDRGARLTYTDPAMGRATLQFRAALSQWWNNEPTYSRRTSGGRFTFTREFAGDSGWRDPALTTVAGTYIAEYERYALTERALADVSLREELIALGLDPDTAEASGTTSALALDVQRDTTRNALDPRRGYGVSFHAEKAGNFLGGSFNYSEMMASGRVYVPLGESATWASRVRAGSLFAADTARLPFFKRYFLGGSNSVRGWGRYEVSPLTAGGLPVGGKSMTEASTELRLRFGSSFGAVVFLDGGTVRPGSSDFGIGEWRWAAGPGLRYETPIGPVRVDLGIQLTPIDGLVVDGKPERRRWRLHFSLGQAF